MTKYIRRPFLVLPYTEYNKAISKELMMNFETGQMYVRDKENTDNIPIKSSEVIEILEFEIDKLLGGVGKDGDTFRKLELLINDLLDWKNTITNINWTDIFNFLNDNMNDLIDDRENIIELLYNKVDKYPNKILSTYDFTNELRNKLLGLEIRANNYKHPSEKVCNYEPPVTSINDYTDDHIIITKEDIGLKNVEPNANYYIHPNTKQCNAESILSINNKMGEVILDKSDIGLDKLANYDIANNVDVLNKVSNKYITPVTFKYRLDKFIQDNS